MMMVLGNDIRTVKNNLKITKFDLELYQRFFLCSVGSEWWYLDTGIFGEWNVGQRSKFVGRLHDNERVVYTTHKNLPNGLMINKLDYGVRLRMGISRRFAIYGQYRISNLLKVKGATTSDLPKWEIGLQLF